MEMYYSPFATHHSPLSSLDLSRFFRQHDRDAVADRISELGGARDQFLPGRIEFQRTLGHRADQDLQQLWIDGAVESFGRGVHLRSPARRWSLAYGVAGCHDVAIRTSSSSTACCRAFGNGWSGHGKPRNAQ